MADTASERIYRTTSGELVPGSDPGARFLAYAVGDELSGRDAEVWKKRTAPADKSRRPAQNKTAAKPPAKD